MPKTFKNEISTRARNSLCSVVAHFSFHFVRVVVVELISLLLFRRPLPSSSSSSSSSCVRYLRKSSYFVRLFMPKQWRRTAHTAHSTHEIKSNHHHSMDFLYILTLYILDSTQWWSDDDDDDNGRSCEERIKSLSFSFPRGKGRGGTKKTAINSVFYLLFFCRFLFVGRAYSHVNRFGWNRPSTAYGRKSERKRDEEVERN